ITGKLVVGSKSAPIGAMPADAATIDRPLSAPEGAKLVVAEPPARAVMPLPILVGGIGAAVIGLLLLVISLLRSPTGTTAAFQAMPTQPTTPPPSGTLGLAQTQLSQHGVPAAGTPAPRDPGASGVVPSNLGAGSMIGRWEVVRRLGSGGMA